MQPDNHHFSLYITTDKKYILRPDKNRFVAQNPLFHIFLQNIFAIAFISPSFTRVFFNWNITSSLYLEMPLVNMIKLDKIIVFIFSQ